MSAAKNTVGNTNAAAVAYRKKSNHSMLVPANAVSATRRIEPLGAMTATLDMNLSPGVLCCSRGEAYQ